MMTGMRSPTARTPLTRPEQATEGDARERREERVDARDHELGRDDGGEVEHPADRQVDVADDDHEHHAHGEHPVKARWTAAGSSDRGWRKFGLASADEHDQRDERDDDARLLREPRAQRTARPLRSRSRRSEQASRPRTDVRYECTSSSPRFPHGQLCHGLPGAVTPRPAAGWSAWNARWPGPRGPRAPPEWPDRRTRWSTLTAPARYRSMASRMSSGTKPRDPRTASSRQKMSTARTLNGSSARPDQHDPATWSAHGDGLLVDAR